MKGINSKLLLYLLAFFSSSSAFCRIGTWPQNMVITAPATHLMSKPQPRNPSYEKCSYQATQLLFGEHVIALEEHKGWLRIKALDQKAYWNGAWTTCSGWIERTHATAVESFEKRNLVVVKQKAPLAIEATSEGVTLPFCSKLVGIKKNKGTWVVKLASGKKGFIEEKYVANLLATPKDRESLQDLLTERSLLYLGDPYMWAGRTPYLGNTSYSGLTPFPTGVDCSGYMNVLHLSLDIPIPRCAHDQYKESTKLKKLDYAQRGALVFLTYENNEKPGTFNERINHVMMYLGNDRLIESEGDYSGHVRIVLGKQRFGQPIEEIMSGKTTWQYKNLAESPLGNKRVLEASPIGKCIVNFGTYIPQ